MKELKFRKYNKNSTGGKNLKEYGYKIINDYIENNLSLPDLYKKYNISYNQIKQFFLDNNIKLRTISESKLTDKYKSKLNKTLVKKYNCINVSQIDYIKEKKKRTFYKNYGKDNIFKTDNFKRLMIKKNIWVDIDDKYLKYRSEVRKITNKNINKLFESWDGFCFYTGIKLKIDIINYNHPLYRTVDHKTSIIYGFINNLDPREIGNIQNLCICSRRANSKKQGMIEEEFKRLINEDKIR